jgi:hypothetical protein
MKQLKSYFQRVDELKSQLKNMSAAESSPDISRVQPTGYKERVSSRDRQKSGKPATSVNASRKG